MMEAESVFLHFGGAAFQLAGEAALYWPAQNALIVADLHLEKASYFAKYGQMLPPYDSLATLETLDTLARRFGAKAIICLGDNFHDSAGEARLQGQAAILLRELTQRLDWTWITGNHDPALEARWGGEALEELSLDGILFRHEAMPNYAGPEISGHYHPKLRLSVRKRSVVRRAFVCTHSKLILPAFGAYTGGMDAGDAAIMAAVGWQEAHAIIPIKGRLSRFALSASNAAVAK
jgi:uncharacterized protein